MFTLRKAIVAILAVIAQQAAMDKNFKPIDELNGTDTAIERPLNVMITTENELVQLWRAHKEIVGELRSSTGNTVLADTEFPKIDFKTNVMFAYFGGQAQGIGGYRIHSVDLKGKTNRILIEPFSFGGAAVITNPYGMWIFPKPKRTTELELVVGFDNNQPVTKKLGKFEPAKEVPKGTKTGG